MYSLKKVLGMKKVTSDNLKRTREYESAIMLVERQIIIKKPDETNPQKISTIDVVILLDEFKDDSQRINELAREIAKINDRSIVTYAN